MYFFVALFEDYANIRSAQGMEMLQLSTNERLMDAFSRFDKYIQKVIKELCVKRKWQLLRFSHSVSSSKLSCTSITQRTTRR